MIMIRILLLLFLLLLHHVVTFSQPFLYFFSEVRGGEQAKKDLSKNKKIKKDISIFLIYVSIFILLSKFQFHKSPHDFSTILCKRSASRIVVFTFFFRGHQTINHMKGNHICRNNQSI